MRYNVFIMYTYTYRHANIYLNINTNTSILILITDTNANATDKDDYSKNLIKEKRFSGDRHFSSGKNRGSIHKIDPRRSSCIENIVIKSLHQIESSNSLNDDDKAPLRNSSTSLGIASRENDIEESVDTFTNDNDNIGEKDVIMYNISNKKNNNNDNNKNNNNNNNNNSSSSRSSHNNSNTNRQKSSSFNNDNNNNTDYNKLKDMIKAIKKDVSFDIVAIEACLVDDHNYTLSDNDLDIPDTFTFFAKQGMYVYLYFA